MKKKKVNLSERSLDNFIVFGLIAIIIISVFIIVDSFTVQEIGEENIPCLDKYNRPFEDELCIRTIDCSSFGFVAEYKCSDKGIKEKWNWSSGW